MDPSSFGLASKALILQLLTSLLISPISEFSALQSPESRSSLLDVARGRLSFAVRVLLPIFRELNVFGPTRRTWLDRMGGFFASKAVEKGEVYCASRD